MYQLLAENKLKELCGERTKVFLLTEGQVLVSFCTLAEMDEIRDTEFSPWVGFVYTFPQHRGQQSNFRKQGYLYFRRSKIPMAKNKVEGLVYSKLSFSS